MKQENLKLWEDKFRAKLQLSVRFTVTYQSETPRTVCFPFLLLNGIISK